MLDDICEQLKAGESSIIGVMIESHIDSGRQDIPPMGAKALKYGVSITDVCVDWATTVPMLDKLNEVSSPVAFLTLWLCFFDSLCAGCEGAEAESAACGIGSEDVRMKYNYFVFISWFM